MRASFERKLSKKKIITIITSLIIAVVGLFNKETIANTLDRIYLDSEREQLEEKIKWDEVSADAFEITDKVSTCAMCKFKPLCIHMIQNNFQYDEDRYSKLVQTAELA